MRHRDICVALAFDNFQHDLTGLFGLFLCFFFSFFIDLKSHLFACICVTDKPQAWYAQKYAMYVIDQCALFVGIICCQLNYIEMNTQQESELESEAKL